VHIIVLVLGEAAAENNMGFALREGTIVLETSLVSFIIDGVIGLKPLFPFPWEFFGDYGVVRLCEFEVFVFDDSGVGSFGVGVVDDGVILEIFLVEDFFFEA